MRTRAFLTSRRGLMVVNGILAVGLVGALALLAWQLSAKGLVVRGGPDISGVRPILSIKGSGRGQFPEIDRVAGVAFTPDGDIIAVDAASHRVMVFGPKGRYKSEFGGFGAALPAPGFEPNWEPGLLNVPLGVDVDEQGRIYVADSRNGHVQVFDADGAFIRRFPERGEGENTAKPSGPRTIAIRDVAVAGGLVFAAEPHRIVVFTTDGEYVRELGREGTGSSEFGDVTGVGAGDDGRVFVVDARDKRVHALTAEGEKLWEIGSVTGDEAQSTVVVGYEFVGPVDVTILAGGSLAVLEAAEGSIVLFRPDGHLLGRYGQRGTAPGELQGATHIDALGNRLVISDTGNARVQVVEIAP